MGDDVSATLCVVGWWWWVVDGWMAGWLDWKWLLMMLLSLDHTVLFPGAASLIDAVFAICACVVELDG